MNQAVSIISLSFCHIPAQWGCWLHFVVGEAEACGEGPKLQGLGGAWVPLPPLFLDTCSFWNALRSSRAFRSVEVTLWERLPLPGRPSEGLLPSPASLPPTFSSAGSSSPRCLKPCLLFTCCSKTLPWWYSDGNLPASAGDRGSIPGREDPTCPGAAKPVRHDY